MGEPVCSAYFMPADPDQNCLFLSHTHSAIECTRPDDTKGYTIGSETLNAPNFAISFTDDACASGYSGKPEATVCTSAGPYQLKGCTGARGALYG